MSRLRATLLALANIGLFFGVLGFALWCWVLFFRLLRHLAG